MDNIKRNVWIKASDMYEEGNTEEGNTKDQSLTAKQLVTKPVFRQQYFSCISMLACPTPSRRRFGWRSEFERAEGQGYSIPLHQRSAESILPVRYV